MASAAELQRSRNSLVNSGTSCLDAQKASVLHPPPPPSLTDTVFGNGKTPDYLLLGNMVYTVSNFPSTDVPAQFTLRWFSVLKGPGRPGSTGMLSSDVAGRMSAKHNNE